MLMLLSLGQVLGLFRTHANQKESLIKAKIVEHQCLLLLIYQPEYMKI
jgi:hypothetical protein